MADKSDGEDTADDSDDRPRGFLTPTDRNWLKGKLQYDHRQSTSDRRVKVVERLTNGLRDLYYLRFLEQKLTTRKRVYEKLTVSRLHAALENFLTFAYLFLYHEMGPEEGRQRMESIISSGLYHAISKVDTDGEVMKVDVDIEPKYEQSPGVLYGAFLKGEELSPEQVGVLVQSGILDEKELHELVET